MKLLIYILPLLMSLAQHPFLPLPCPALPCSGFLFLHTSTFTCAVDSIPNTLVLYLPPNFSSLYNSTTTTKLSSKQLFITFPFSLKYQKKKHSQPLTLYI